MPFDPTTTADRPSDTRPRPSPLPLAAAFVVALSIRLGAAYLTHHEPAVDVHTFWAWAKLFDAGLDPYAIDVSPANYPPPWIYLCWLCLKISMASGASFDLVMETFVSLFDSATVIPVALAAIACGASVKQSYGAAFFYAVNPVPILIAAFHAQNDPIVIGLVMWASWLLMTRPFRWAAETGLLLLGSSLVIKPVGILFLPILLAHVPSWVGRVRCLVVAILPSGLCWLPDLLERPWFVLRTLTGYGGVPDFGLVGIVNSWRNVGLGSSGLNVGFEFPWWYRPMCVLLLGLVWWRLRKSSLIEQIVAVLLTLYLVYGNLAAQYLMWLVPFATALRSSRLVRTSLFTAVTLVAFYQLHHPAILSGSIGHRIPTPIATRQWAVLFLFAHVMVYATWLVWLLEILRKRPPVGATSGVRDP